MPGSPSAKSVEMQQNQDFSVEVQEQIDELDVNCSICLQPMEDRTIIPKCSHEFCFNCLIIWTGICSLDLKLSAGLQDKK